MSTEAAFEVIRVNMATLQQRKETEILDELRRMKTEWKQAQKAVQSMKTEVQQLESEITFYRYPQPGQADTRLLREVDRKNASANRGPKDEDKLAVTREMLQESKAELSQLEAEVQAEEQKNMRRVALVDVTAGVTAAVLQGVALSLACTVM